MRQSSLAFFRAIPNFIGGINRRKRYQNMFFVIRIASRKLAGKIYFPRGFVHGDGRLNIFYFSVKDRFAAITG